MVAHRKRAAGLLFACALGCGSLRSSFSPDGGGTSPDAGGNPADSGSGTDAGNPVPDGGFSWVALSPPNGPSEIDALAGIGSSSSLILYATDNNGYIDRYQDGGWTTAYHGGQWASLWVAPDTGTLFAGGTGGLVCSPACQAYPVTLGLTGVCGLSSGVVWGVGNDASNLGYLYRWNPGGPSWDQVAVDTSNSNYAACWVRGDGAVFIAAQHAVVRYDGALTAETINWPANYSSSDINAMYFQGIGGLGSQLYVTGSRQRIFARSDAGTWGASFDPSWNTDFHAFFMVAANSAMAAGTGTPSQNVDALLSGTGWSYDPSPPYIDVKAIWAASPTEYYLGGLVPSGVTGLLFRGNR